MVTSLIIWGNNEKKDYFHLNCYFITSCSCFWAGRLLFFFSRKGKELPKNLNAEDYKPGDIVCWMLPDELTHIGIVVDEKARGTNRYAIVHNIGGGQVMENCLFSFKLLGITGMENRMKTGSDRPSG